METSRMDGVSSTLMPVIPPPRREPAEPGYRMLSDGSQVALAEVEQVGVAAVEVQMSWGKNVLSVQQFSPLRPVWIGEESTRDALCDFLLPADVTGMHRFPLLLVNDGIVKVVIPMGASASRTSRERRLPFASDPLETEPLVALAGAQAIRLRDEERVLIEIGAFCFTVTAGQAGRRAPRAFFSKSNLHALPYLGASFVSVAALLAAVAWLTPNLGLSDAEGIDDQQIYAMKAYLDSASERETTPPEPTSGRESGESSGSDGQQAAGEEGKLGARNAAVTNAHYGVKGPQDNPTPELSRHEAMEMAATFGMIGLLNGAVHDQDSPVAKFGADVPLGRDAISAQGAMWGDVIGQNFGDYGLGLSCCGEGGGGKGIGIGLGEVGTLGGGNGILPGRGLGPGGWGRSDAWKKGAHATKVPTMKV